ncbi:ABC transporter permease [Natronincola ferrireducens]|uniref:Nucleoside ABC transporter membrane protein n=1 Tax=Natronincola ferrireducens TaxID=393762 RepID=A0A1G9A725_9FIRM|nr:ABC transporter permease [Natronincola ferrireducens]SDK23088.1 nucleoside ABC transporter membrane protein [Natronincola ferrireducens]
MSVISKINNKTKNILSKVLNSKDVTISFISFLLALGISSIIIFLNGYSPIVVFNGIYQGSFGNARAFFQTLVQATPIIFTGLAFTVAFKAGLINIGAEGQLYMGAISAALVGVYISGLPMIIHISLALLAGIIAGGLWGALVGFLKVRFGSNEVITTIMLNFIAISFTSYLVNYPLKAEGSHVAQTERILPSATLVRLFSGSQITIAFIIAIVTAISIEYMLKKTLFGYEVRVVGLNPKAAETAGIKTKRILLYTMFLSGAIAGLAGATQILGVQRRFVDHFSAGFGFDGIAVAALAANNPLGVILSGILFGALRAGSMTLNRITNIPADIVGIIQSLVIIFVAAPLLVRQITNVSSKGKNNIKQKEE